MQIRTLVRLTLVGVAGIALAGCVYDGEYAASAGYGGGYANGGGYYDDGYGGYAGGYYDDPAYYGGGYGWYNGFWYPGSGLFVYDRYGHGRRWSDGERNHWYNHGQNGGRPGYGRPGYGRPGGWQGGNHDGNGGPRPGYDHGGQGNNGHSAPPPYTGGGHWPPRGNGGGQWTPPPHRDGFVNGVGRAVGGRHGRH